MGENFVGEKLSDKSGLELARNYLLPLTANALYENFAKNPDDPLAAIFNAVPTFYGMTSSTYSRDPLDRVVAQGDEAKRRAKAAAETGDTAAAGRTMSALGERGETYSAAKVAKNAEKKLKDLQKKEKELSVAISRAGDSASEGLRKDHEAVLRGIEELKSELPALREQAIKTYRANRGTQDWGDMGWTER